MEDKLVAIELANGTFFDGILKFKEGFTTNKNYLGHTNENVPVYTNRLLKEGEIKYIMNNQEIKVLEEGKYLAKVEQVIRKNGKTNGEEDPTKKVISVELNVKDHNDRFYYVVFCVEGYSDDQVRYAKEDIEKICEEFGISIIEELAGKIVMLNAVKNKNGYTNYFIHEKKDFYNWEDFEGFKYNEEIKLPCIVKKFYKNGNKIIVQTMVNINGKDMEEFIVYDLNNDYRVESLGWAMKKLEINEDYLDTELNKKAYLIVKKVVKGDKTFYNKRLGFDKPEKRKPAKW